MISETSFVHSRPRVSQVTCTSPEVCVVKWTNYPDVFQFAPSRSNSLRACFGATSVKCGLHGGLPAERKLSPPGESGQVLFLPGRMPSSV